MARYKGYSSENYEKNGTFLLTDIELVKYDLLNHLFTRRGERVRMPNFGTIIPDLVFEPLDETLIDIVYEEILKVINAEPRLRLLNLAVTPDYDAHALTVQIYVEYIEFNMLDNINFTIQFAEG